MIFHVANSATRTLMFFTVKIELFVVFVAKFVNLQESTEKESVNWKVNLIMSILIPVIYYRISTSCQVLHFSVECVKAAIVLSHQKSGALIEVYLKSYMVTLEE
jgi:hypothetical protein